jgi:hypothetical protein
VSEPMLCQYVCRRAVSSLPLQAFCAVTSNCYFFQAHWVVPPTLLPAHIQCDKRPLSKLQMPSWNLFCGVPLQGNLYIAETVASCIADLHGESSLYLSN